MSDTTPVSEAFVEVSLSSGVTVLVRTLTPLVIQRLALKAESLFPFPNKTEYEKPKPGALPDTNAIIPAEQNPDYQAAVNEAFSAQARWLFERILDVAVTAPDEAAVIANYAPAVAKLRKVDVLVYEEGDSDFMIVLRNFLAVDLKDINHITVAAQMSAPLTEVETRDGRAIFRLQDQRQAARNGIIRTLTPRVERKTQRKQEPAVVGN